MQFEWDIDKYKINLKKQGISFEEATTVWTDILVRSPTGTECIKEV